MIKAIGKNRMDALRRTFIQNGMGQIWVVKPGQLKNLKGVESLKSLPNLNRELINFTSRKLGIQITDILCDSEGRIPILTADPPFMKRVEDSNGNLEVLGHTMALEMEDENSGKLYLLKNHENTITAGSRSVKSDDIREGDKLSKHENHMLTNMPVMVDNRKLNVHVLGWYGLFAISHPLNECGVEMNGLNKEEAIEVLDLLPYHNSSDILVDWPKGIKRLDLKIEKTAEGHITVTRTGRKREDSKSPILPEATIEWRLFEKTPGVLKQDNALTARTDLPLIEADIFFNNEVTRVKLADPFNAFCDVAGVMNISITGLNRSESIKVLDGILRDHPEAFVKQLGRRATIKLIISKSPDGRVWIDKESRGGTDFSIGAFTPSSSHTWYFELEK